MINLNDLKIGMRVKNSNGNSFIKITKISKFNVFVKPTNYPCYHSEKVSISEFLRDYEIVNK